MLDLCIVETSDKTETSKSATEPSKTVVCSSEAWICD